MYGLKHPVFTAKQTIVMEQADNRKSIAENMTDSSGCRYDFPPLISSVTVISILYITILSYGSYRLSEDIVFHCQGELDVLSAVSCYVVHIGYIDEINSSVE